MSIYHLEDHHFQSPDFYFQKPRLDLSSWFFATATNTADFFRVSPNTLNFSECLSNTWIFSECFRNTLNLKKKSVCAKIIIRVNKTHDDGEVILEAITDHFDRFFHASLDGDAVPSLYWALWLVIRTYISIFSHFCIVVIFRKLKIQTETSGDWKWWSSKWNMNTKLIGLPYIRPT